ncbi:MAG TPA: hypothetical protein PK095_08150, partial [Myxococcota bacterium]|nr:hypothetical protein [Myxococcota bacterium]
MLLIAGTLFAAGCSEPEPVPLKTQAEESFSAESRWAALEQLRAEGSWNQERVLLDMIRSDPSPENRLRASELAGGLVLNELDAHIAFGPSFFFDPDLRVRIATTRAWANSVEGTGLARVVEHAMACLVDSQLTVDCHPAHLVVKEKARESMALLLPRAVSSKNTSPSEPKPGDQTWDEATLELATVLLEGEPTLVSEPAVRRWLEDRRDHGFTERARNMASAMLGAEARP